MTSWQIFKFKSMLAVAGLLLSSCAWTPIETRDNSTVDEIQRIMEEAAATTEAANNAEPPEAISDELMPGLSAAMMAAPALDDRFDVYVEDVEARSFFMGLVKGTPFNMVVHPKVAGTISLELSNVSVAEVMDVVREVYGYPYKKKGNLYQVLPGGLRSEVFQIDYLSLKRKGSSESQVSAGQVSSAGSSNSGGSNNSNGNNSSNNNNNNSNNNGNQAIVGTRITTETEADFWTELQSTLQVLIGEGDGQRVVVTPQAGVVVVRANAIELEVVREYLRRAEMIMRRQVVLETKILEVRLSDSYQSGVDWSVLSTSGGDTINWGMSGSAPESSTGGIFGIGIDAGDFTGVLQFLETQGSVQVLSSPRISTINNQKALIKVGQDEFFVTEISNTTTDTASGIRDTPEVELTPFFSGIALDVTPQISEDNEIILHIHPSISQVEDQVKTIQLGDSVVELPLALSTIRETDSIVFARSGQVVVLGGLMQNIAADENNGMPGMADIPVLGHLFSQERNSTIKSELIILLKPIIMGSNGLPEDLSESARRFDQFRDDMEPAYHFGNPK